jgi:rhodanese-related sulfurtransferase
MKKIVLLVFLQLYYFSYAQKSIPKVLDKLNKKTVPYITPEELKSKKNYVILDSREAKEYQVSHLKKAIHVGYDKFNSKIVLDAVKDFETPIVVYCSIGVRSEIIGEKLLKLGYKNVYNLYGGIFDWKNKEFKVENGDNKETDSIHTFNKNWSFYLKKGIKVYEN